MSPSSPGAYSRFIASFRPDQFPFCPVGMGLLFFLQRSRPELYAAAELYGFAHFDDAVYQTSPDAVALMHHVASCAECQAC